MLLRTLPKNNTKEKLESSRFKETGLFFFSLKFYGLVTLSRIFITFNLFTSSGYSVEGQPLYCER